MGFWLTMIEVLIIAAKLMVGAWLVWSGRLISQDPNRWIVVWASWLSQKRWACGMIRIIGFAEIFGGLMLFLSVAADVATHFQWYQASMYSHALPFVPVAAILLQPRVSRRGSAGNSIAISGS